MELTEYFLKLLFGSGVVGLIVVFLGKTIINKSADLILAEHKNSLDLLSKTKLVIYDDERNAIVEFIGAITDFYESNINIPNESATPEGLAYIQERIRVLEIDYGKVQIAKSKLKLFCFNEEILNASKPILLKLTEIQGQAQLFRFKVLGNLKLNSIYSQQTDAESLKKLKDIVDEETKLHKDFWIFKNNFCIDYFAKYNDFLSICKNYLKTKKPL